MKAYKKLIAKSLVVVLALSVAAVGLVSAQRANAQQQMTPIFNNFDGVPGMGDESEFVRLRNSNGDPTASAITTPFNDVTLNSACNVGSMFDVRTYVHNGAHPSGNNEGTGEAIAHNTTVHSVAPLGTTGKKFNFGSTISASNAATVAATGTLNCGSDVRLELVPSKVYVYTKSLGWKQATDSAVNGTLKIGTKVFGSGDVWACWDERVMVVYTVKVVKVPEQPAPEFKCDLLTITRIGDTNSRRYKFEVTHTVKNGATFKDVTFDFGDGTTQTVAANSTEHTYSEVKKFAAKATVNFTVNGETKSHTQASCAKEITVTQEVCPLPGKGHLPKNSPECVEVLPSTGAGEMFGIIFSVIVGSYIWATRRFARN